MTGAQEQFVTDPSGRRVGVLLDIREYERMLAELEELESIRAYDSAKAAGDEAVPFDRAIQEIERERARRTTSFPSSGGR
jgi:hypothetical protein